MIILYILLLIVVVAIALFVYESIQFNNYISSPEINEMNIPINQESPVKSQGEIVINAPTEKVWQILTTINNWPTWQSEVTESNLEEELKERAEFKWKAGGLSFTSQIHTVDPKDIKRAKKNPLVIDFIEKPLKKATLRKMFG